MLRWSVDGLWRLRRSIVGTRSVVRKRLLLMVMFLTASESERREERLQEGRLMLLRLPRWWAVREVLLLLLVVMLLVVYLRGWAVRGSWRWMVGGSGGGRRWTVLDVDLRWSKVLHRDAVLLVGHYRTGRWRWNVRWGRWIVTGCRRSVDRSGQLGRGERSR